MNAVNDLSNMGQKKLDHEELWQYNRSACYCSLRVGPVVVPERVQWEAEAANDGEQLGKHSSNRTNSSTLGSRYNTSRRTHGSLSKGWDAIGTWVRCQEGVRRAGPATNATSTMIDRLYLVIKRFHPGGEKTRCGSRQYRK